MRLRLHASAATVAAMTSIGPVLLVLVLVVAGCVGPPPVDVSRVAARLVDPSHLAAATLTAADHDERALLADATSDAAAQTDTAADADTAAAAETHTAPPRIAPATATILDETREVLAAPSTRILLWAPSAKRAPDGTLRVGLNLEEKGLASLRRVLVASSVRGHGLWMRLPGRVIDPSRLAQPMPWVVELPDEIDEATVGLVVEGVEVEASSSSRIHVPLPNLGGTPLRLEFATGVHEAAWTAGSVRFAIDACRADACREVFATIVDPATDQAGRWTDRAVDLGTSNGAATDEQAETAAKEELAAAAPDALVFRTELLARENAAQGEGEAATNGDVEAATPSEEEAALLGLWANPTLRRTESVAARRPNVILISLDTLRADFLPVYGHPRDTAPFMTEYFGAGGVVFEHGVAAATATPPSHMAMFTGLQPLEHGLATGRESLDPAIVPLAERLRAAGIATGAVTEDGWLGIQHGFARGFEGYEENKSPDIMAPLGQVDRTFARAREWMRARGDREFFLFLHTFQVHDPYVPPPQYAALFPAADIEAGSPGHEREVDLPNYEAEIRFVDDELRRLVGFLGEIGIAENTVVIVTSDHGEAFLEHGHRLHGSMLHEEVTRVPLLVRGPGVAAARRIAAPVAHVDLAPTIAALAGVAFADDSRAVNLEGLLRGKHDEAVLAGRFLFTESWGGRRYVEGGGWETFFPPAFAVRHGSRKLARYGDASGGHVHEFYDLASDPRELDEIYEAQRAQLGDLERALDSYPAESLERRRAVLAAGADRGAHDAPSEESILDPRQEEKLRALGYLD